MKCAAQYYSNGGFLGGHPMAGKESRGVEAAEAELFQGRTYILAPAAELDLHRPIIREFLSLVESHLGARTLVMEPAVHDRVLAFTSHLAQMASTALSCTVLENVTDAGHLRTAGPGLHDMSRLSLSSYEIWNDIIATNSSEIIHALDAYIAQLQGMKSIISTLGVRDHFEKGSDLARSIRRQGS
jgi:prephenate dehydrogenase